MSQIISERVTGGNRDGASTSLDKRFKFQPARADRTGPRPFALLLNIPPLDPE